MADVDLEDQLQRRFLEDWHRPLPWLTIAALAVMVAFMAADALEPAVLEALRRNPVALRGGQWWRVLSPVLVQSAGWGQFAVNFVALAVVGAAVERRMGRSSWVLLALAGAAAGEAAGYLWDPTGAGSSVAVCGLVGGFLVFALLGGLNRAWALEFSCYWVSALAGYALFGAAGAIGFCVVLALMLAVGRLGRIAGHYFRRLLIGAMLAEALFLVFLADDHGPALCAGALAAFLLRRPRPAVRAPDP